MTNRNLNLSRYLIWVFIGLCFAGLLLRHLDRTTTRGTDFKVYYVTAQRFLDRADIYERADESVTPFKYSPLFAFLMSPLTFFSLKTAGGIFFTINFISLGAVLFYSKKLITDEVISFRKKLVLYGLPILLSLRFILGVFDSGQATLVMMALVVLSLFHIEKGRPILGGALLALSMMFKYMPFIFIPYFVLKKKFKVVSFTILLTFFYCILPAVYTGVEKEKDTLTHWIPSISQTSLDRGSWTDYKNQSLYSLVVRYVMKDSPYQAVVHSVSLLTFNQALILSILLSVMIYLLMIFPRGNLPCNNTIEYSLLFIGIALFNPNAWTFNYVSMIFAFMVLVYYFTKKGVTNHKLSFTLMILAFFLTSGGSSSLVGKQNQYLSEVISTVTMGAIIMVFVLCGLKYKKAIP